MLRKGKRGKEEFAQLMVPSDTNLAIKVTRNSNQERKEKEAIKAIVLNYEESLAEKTEEDEVSAALFGVKDYAKITDKQGNLRRIKQRNLDGRDGNGGRGGPGPGRGRGRGGGGRRLASF